MNKLLVICGPTAVGKSSLAFALAGKFDGEIISADSKQVFKGMDIGTGKEWAGGTKIWGYDLVGPKEEFSVAAYLKFARKVIPDIENRGKLPIIVGGTGLYIKGIVDGIPTVDVPRNEELREMLAKKSAEELFEVLSQIDSIKAASLNSSDKKNPRRLVRAVEVAQYLIDHKLPVDKSAGSKTRNVLWIGLTAPKVVLERKIEARVRERARMGIKKEIENLLAEGVSWDDQSMLSLGYRQWRDFFEGGVDEEHVAAEWKKEEIRYARRQITWFKKDRRIRWFDVTELKYPENVEKLVKKWHNMSHV